MSDQILLEGLSLTGRMLAKSPAEGYRLWLDVTATDATRIIVAEAPAGALEADPVWRGIRLTLVNKRPLGPVEVAEDFAWTERATAGWS